MLLRPHDCLACAMMQLLWTHTGRPKARTRRSIQHPLLAVASLDSSAPCVRPGLGAGTARRLDALVRVSPIYNPSQDSSISNWAVFLGFRVSGVGLVNLCTDKQTPQPPATNTKHPHEAIAARHGTPSNTSAEGRPAACGADEKQQGQNHANGMNVHCMGGGGGMLQGVKGQPSLQKHLGQARPQRRIRQGRNAPC